MKITYLTSTFHKEPAGIHARFHDLIHELDSLDEQPFDFEVVTCNLEEVQSKCGYETWDSNGASRPRQLARFMRAVRRRNRETDVFHLNQCNLQLSVPTLIAVDNEVPLVVGPNISTFTRPGIEWTLPWSWRRIKLHLRIGTVYRNRLVFHRSSPLSRHVDLNIALSNFHKQELVRSGMHPEKIEVLPTGVRRSMFSPATEQWSDDTNSILYVGDTTQTHWKGFDVFVEGLAELSDDGYDFEAIVVGNTPDAVGLNLIETNGLKDKIRFAGRVERSSLSEQYRRATVFVNSSRYETEGMTSVEARACGIPVVGSDIPPFEEKNVLSFPKGDPEGLAYALGSLFDDKENHHEHARRTASKFYLDDTIRTVEQAYRELAR